MGITTMLTQRFTLKPKGSQCTSVVGECQSHKILTPLQVKNLKSDKLKMDFYKENGFEVLIVWERDLKFNLEKEREKIKNFVYGK